MPEDDIVFWACVYKCICHITSAPAEWCSKLENGYILMG